LPLLNFFAFSGVSAIFSGGMNFCLPALSAEGGQRVESGSSLRQQGSKARKNCLLN